MDDCKNILNEVFEIESFREEQEIVIKEIINDESKNYIISMASQGGKSLCYQIPALYKATVKGGVTIIISPSLALINDLLESFAAKNIEVASISTLDKSKTRKVSLKKLNEGSTLKFFIFTPEMYEENQELKDILSSLIKEQKINYIVFDEANYMDAINTGHNVGVKLKENRETKFKNLKTFREESLEVPWIILTTVNEDHASALCEDLGMTGSGKKSSCFFSFPVRRENLFYSVLKRTKGKNNKNSCIDLTNKLLKDNKNASGIIFCNGKPMIDNIVENLKTVAISCYKEGNNKETRKNGEISPENIRKWSNGEFRVIVASSECFRFGLNYLVPPKIRFVIHRYVPENLHAYYQESGRAGNDGEKSYAYLITEGKNEKYSKEVQKYLNLKCRHQTLDEYYGFTTEACDNMCDVCALNNLN